MPVKQMLTGGDDADHPAPYRPHGKHDVPILPPVGSSQPGKASNLPGSKGPPAPKGSPYRVGGGAHQGLDAPTPHDSRPGSSRAGGGSPVPKIGINDEPPSDSPAPGGNQGGDEDSHIGNTTGGGGGGPGGKTPFPPPPASTHQPAAESSPTDHYRFLNPDEWARVAHGLGAIKTGEEHAIVHPKRCLWAQRGLPDGLYRTVITERTKYRIMYHIVATMTWILMIMQIVIGAVLTSLGSLKLAGNNSSTPITILAAVQTVIAGLLALLHNSGVPDRYRSNRCEFSKVEDHLRELLNTGVVPTDQSVDSVIADCWQRYQRAKATVQANMPANYIPSSNLDHSNLPPPKSGTGAFMKHVASG